MLDTPQEGSRKTLTLVILTLLTTPLVFTTLADEPKIDDTNIIKRRGCPEIKVGDGKNVHVLGYSKGAFLGVELTDLSPELRGHFGVPGDDGVMISRVVPGSAAEAAGLAVGDIITAVGGDDVSSSSALGRSMRSHKGGELLSIEFWRNGSSHQATATLEEQERCALDVGEFMEGFDFAGLSELGLGISEEVMKGLHEALEGQDWGQHFEALKHLNLEGLKSLEGLKVLEGIEGLEGLEILEGLEVLEGIDGLEGLEILEGLEERMERVQERLKHLEQDLEREVGRKVEQKVERRVEREVEREVRQEKRNRERALHRAERDRRLKEGIDLEEDGEKSAEDLGNLKL